MPYSKIATDYEFNDRKWVVSFINTKTGSKGLIGGHAKIVVEGIIDTCTSTFYSEKLFVAEYHIMEADRVPEETWIPQAFINTRCNYLVLYTERDLYTKGQEQQYSEVSAKSWFAAPEAIRIMIDDIKSERAKILVGDVSAKFQYAGMWCIYSYRGGHNCTTWAEEKLFLAGVGSGILPSDSSKAIPEVHTRWTCVLL